MTVADLIAFLQTLQQDMFVAALQYSEHRLLEPGDLSIEELCTPRSDGWIHDKRPDKPSQLYLVLPGN